MRLALGGGHSTSPSVGGVTGGCGVSGVSIFSVSVSRPSSTSSCG